MIVLALALSLSTLNPHTSAAAAALCDEPDFGTNRVPANSHAYFECVMNLLQQLVDHRGRAGEHELYLSQVGSFGYGQMLRVYWPSDQSIILVHLSSLSCDQRDRTIDDADWLWWDGRARIDLDCDVVETQSDVGTSTYLVSRGWVNGVIDDCKANGYRATFNKTLP